MNSRTALVSLACFAVGLYLAALIALCLWQDQLIFPAPTSFSSSTPTAVGLAFDDLHIPVDNSTQLHAWWIPAAQATRKVILYFHGNGYTLESEAQLEAPLFSATGANLLLVDYRGYGASSPLRTNGPSTEADARAAMRYLSQHRRFAASDVVIAGRSIGSAVAAGLAVESPHAAGLVLLSPITNTRDVANEQWIFRYLLRPAEWFAHRNDFDTVARISSIHIPLLIVTGTRDELAPTWMARAIYNHANQPKSMKLIDGARHNDLLEPRDGTLTRLLKAFVDDPANSIY